MTEHPDMLENITLPSFGSSVGEATIVQWLVEAGATVEAGEIIAEIETDKAMAELEAPADGVIEAIVVEAGTENVEVGTVLAQLRTQGAAPSASSEAEPAEAPQAAPDPVVNREPTPPEAPVAAGEDTSERIIASPYAKKLAGERGIDLSALSGSGPGGRVVSRDLGDATAQPAQDGDALGGFGFPPDSYELQPHSRMRRAIAEGLTRSVREIPHFSLTVDVDLGPVVAHRKQWSGPDPRPSVNDYFVWACARALKDVPAANASWTPHAIARHRSANVAVAVALEDGLVTPVVQGADALKLPVLAETTKQLVQRAKDGALKTRDLQGATFTISNLGMMGIRSFNSILSAPQACILSVGAMEERAVVRDGTISTALQATCTLTCDHRVVDGAVGALFLQALARHLGAPAD